MTLRLITAAEVRHKRREREREKREIERERDKTGTRKGRKGALTDREKETGIFSMMGFDSATSSFQALLINISYKN